MLTEEIITKLTDAGVVLYETNFFSGPIPAEVQLPAGGIIETPGSRPLETLADGITFENCGFQVTVRGENTAVGDQQARAFIREIWKTLAGGHGTMGVANEAIDGVMYQNISARQSPFLLQIDENNKRVYVANFDVAKEIS